MSIPFVLLLRWRDTPRGRTVVPGARDWQTGLRAVCMPLSLHVGTCCRNACFHALRSSTITAAAVWDATPWEPPLYGPQNEAIALYTVHAEGCGVAVCRQPFLLSFRSADSQTAAVKLSDCTWPTVRRFPTLFQTHPHPHPHTPRPVGEGVQCVSAREGRASSPPPFEVGGVYNPQKCPHPWVDIPRASSPRVHDWWFNNGYRV